jgi:hypothetical protein
MTMVYSPNIIGAEGSMINPMKIIGNARSAGPIIGYEFKSALPKRQFKELRAVLLPEKKKFVIVKIGYKFNVRDRCVVCGVHHVWDVGDTLRPPIPLSEVTKGRPLQGTYCPRHASFFKQLETIEQQMIAEKHGLEFKKYVPRPKMPQIMNRGPLVTLSERDIVSLSAKGWEITPPVAETVSAEEKLIILLIELKSKMAQIDELVGER